MRLTKTGVYAVIIHFRGQSDTQNCIQSLLDQTVRCDQIIVVNNSGNDFILTTLKDKCIVIHSPENRGYAAACNYGIDYVNKNFNSKFLWFLNNDTEVDKKCLENLLICCNGNTGLVGSKILYHSKRNIIQGIAGKYNKFLCITKHIGNGSVDSSKFNLSKLKFDYPMGVSLFTQKAFVDEVGKMNSDYFLYFEELDWVFRAKRKNWEVSLCLDSKVYHKGGASIEASKEHRSGKSALSDFHSIKSKLIFTKAHIPHYLPFLYLFFIFLAFEMLFRGKPKRIKMITDIIKNNQIGFKESRYK